MGTVKAGDAISVVLAMEERAAVMIVVIEVVVDNRTAVFVVIEVVEETVVCGVDLTNADGDGTLECEALETGIVDNVLEEAVLTRDRAVL